MTISGDLEAGLWAELGHERARQVVERFFDFLHDGNVINYLRDDGFTDDDIVCFLDAARALKAKCLTSPPS